MADRPCLLDLFSCEGGAAVGYHRAGWEVIGVDLEPRFAKRYPFRFFHLDAIRVLDDLVAFAERGWQLPYDAISSSPPCQHASAGTRARDRSKYPALIEPVRERLEALGLPYVIENVEGAALRDPVTLCGTMFGLTAIDTDGTPLELWRHRGFETNWPLTAPGPCRHHEFSEQVAGCYGGARSDKHEARNVRHGGYVPKDKRVLQELMGIDWMTKSGMYQALPPVYTEHIGRQLLVHIERQAVAA